LLTKLRTFLLNIQRLNNPAKFMIGEDLLESRRFVRSRLDGFSFDDFAQKCAAPEKTCEPVEETFLGRVRELCLRHGASADGWTDHQLLLIFGLVPNVMAASTWMVHHLLADPALMAEVRRELAGCIDGSAGTSGSIDLAKGPETCPHLYAVWYEVLRFHGGFVIGRYVHEDTSLAGEYLLKKGSFLLAPLRPHHFDRKIWGPDVDTFRPARFLTGDGKLNYGPTKNLRVYGLFGSLCPGRFLAVHFAIVGIIRLLLAFEILPVKKPHVPPDECKDTLVGLVTPAWDAEVSLEKRRDDRPVRIIYDGIGQLT
jgi:cytochrome P450